MGERRAWNRRYAEGEYIPRPEPTPFLEEWIDLFPPGRALDVACGAGRNSLRLAEAGFEVDAVDISDVAVEMAKTAAARRSLAVNWMVMDAAELAPAAGTYQAITVIRYRNPALWPRLVEVLAPGGWIVVEHHFKTTLDVLGPQTQEFRLDPQELLRAFARLRIVHYAETIEPSYDRSGRFAIARLAACKGDPGF